MMPRDMDLIRELMLRFERNDASLPSGKTMEEVAYHVSQMKRSGLVDAEIIEAPSPGKMKPVQFIIHDLTPAGHDFIAQIRDDRLWLKVKAAAKKKVVPLTMELVVEIAKMVARS